MFIAVGDDEYHNPKPEDWLHDLDMEAHLLYNQVVRVSQVSMPNFASTTAGTIGTCGRAALPKV